MLPSPMSHGPARRPATPLQKPVYVAALGLLLIACGGPGPDPFPPHRLRNVILLLPDTLRADHLGTYGYERDTSPELDALARRGVVFERAVSQASCTFPSVNSLLTSRYPQAFLGRPAGEMGLPEGIPGLAEILDARGYDTVAISASPIVRKTPGKHNPNGGFGRGFDVFDESCEWGPSACVHARALEALDALGHHRGGEATGDSGDPQAGEERPFFLYLHYMDPHDPYWRPPELKGRFAGPYEGEHAFIPEGDPNPIGEMLYDDGPELELTDEDLRHLVAAYDEAIAYFDGQLALLLGELEARGLLEDTLLAVVSDHGEEFLEHGHIKHCRTVYDTEIKTPLILVGPGLGSGRVAPVVENLDLVPTVLDYLGIEPEAGTPETEMVGTSLRPLIESLGVESSQPPPGEGFGQGFSWQATKRSLTEERFKLIVHVDGRFELYDLATDPAETRDILKEERRTFAGLRGDLVGWMRRMEPGLFGVGPRVGEDFEAKMKSLGYLN